MKYTEKYSAHPKKLGTGFYVLIACCLLVIGGAIWFALSNMEYGSTTPPLNSGGNNSYYDAPSSYNENTYEPREENKLPNLNTESAAQSVESEPYSEPEETAPESPQNFTMPIADGKILKGFSSTELQYSNTYGDMRIHNGIDIAAKNGTAVSACGDGVVKSISTTAELGTVVEIELAGGISVKYASLTDLKVEEGSSVSAGDIIGSVDTVPAECNDENHLHLEIFKGDKAVSPLEILGFQ